MTAGFAEPMVGRHRGIRLIPDDPADDGLPFLGTIAAGRPIEAVPQPGSIQVPPQLRTGRTMCSRSGATPCVTQVSWTVTKWSSSSARPQARLSDAWVPAASCKGWGKGHREPVDVAADGRRTSIERDRFTPAREHPQDPGRMRAKGLPGARRALVRGWSHAWMPARLSIRVGDGRAARGRSRGGRCPNHGAGLACGLIA